MKLIAFDTETYLIQPTESAPKPVCCTWADAPSVWLSHPGDMQTSMTFAQPDVVLVGQNIAYDLVLMMRWHPHLIPSIIRMLDEGRVFDTSMRERLRHLAEHGSQGYEMFPSLEKLALKYLNLDLSKEKRGDDIWRLKYGTLDGVPFSEWPQDALNYALGDARHTYDVFHMQGGVIAIQPTEQDQVRAAVVLQAIGVWGFAINQQKRGVLKSALDAKITAMHGKLDQYGWTGTGSQARLAELVSKAWHYKHTKAISDYASLTGVHLDHATWSQYVTPTMDVKSALLESIDAGTPVPGLIFGPGTDWKAWSKAAAKHLGDGVPMTKKGPSVAAEVLEQLSDVVPQFADYIELRHLEKMVENYIVPYANETVHPRFVPLVTTGRTGCRNPNTQNIPRKDKTRPDEAFRTMFRARPGTKLGTVDYSQLELCTLAATFRTFYPGQLCTLGDAIDKGMDVHCITGGLMLGLSYEQMLEGKKNKDQRVLDARQSAKACFSADTELLTPSGWVPISNLYDSVTPVAQYNPHNKQITFVSPYGWIRKRSPVVRIQTTHMDQLVTPDHRLLFVSRVGVVREVLAGDLHDLRLGGNNWSSVHGGYLQNLGCVSDVCTRLSVMVQADGNFQGNYVRLGFTKRRKIERCRTLLRLANVAFTEDKSQAGVTTFKAERGDWYALTEDKTFLPWTNYALSAFCDELVRWDGHRTRKNHASYGSVIAANTDVAQAILSCCGYKVNGVTVPANKNKQAFHRLEWYLGDRKKNVAYHRFGGLTVSAGPEQLTYCLSVPTSWVLTRRNGKVVVSGNCNFGKPGGLGIGAFIGYAKNNYGVTLDRQGAYKIISAWERAWPEIPNVYLKNNAAKVEGSPTGTMTAFTISGRPKAMCVYTEASNYPFQGLAADGAKAALYAIWRESVLGWYWTQTPGTGYGSHLRDGALRESHIVNFVHDEIVGEHPDGDLGVAAFKRQQELMISEMERVCQNKITIRVDAAMSDAWEH